MDKEEIKKLEALLKRCPFCDSTASLNVFWDESLHSHNSVEYFKVSCSGDALDGDDADGNQQWCEYEFQSSEDWDYVLRSWNRRPDPATKTLKRYKVTSTFSALFDAKDEKEAERMGLEAFKGPFHKLYERTDKVERVKLLNEKD